MEYWQKFKIIPSQKRGRVKNLNLSRSLIHEPFSESPGVFQVLLARVPFILASDEHQWSWQIHKKAEGAELAIAGELAHDLAAFFGYFSNDRTYRL